jgi:hypothetical protein
LKYIKYKGKWNLSDFPQVVCVQVITCTFCAAVILVVLFDPEYYFHDSDVLFLIMNNRSAEKIGGQGIYHYVNYILLSLKANSRSRWLAHICANNTIYYKVKVKSKDSPILGWFLNTHTNFFLVISIPGMPQEFFPPFILVKVQSDVHYFLIIWFLVKFPYSLPVHYRNMFINTTENLSH